MPWYMPCTPGIMILAQAVLQIFYSQGWKRGIPFLCSFHKESFKILCLIVLDRMQCVTDTQTYRPKPICPLSFFEVWGIKTCSPLDFKFYLGKVTNKIFSSMINVNFEAVFIEINFIKSNENSLKIKHYTVWRKFWCWIWGNLFSRHCLYFLKLPESPKITKTAFWLVRT